MENKPTKLSLEQHDIKMSAEMSWDAGLTDILDSFYGLLVGVTFQPNMIISIMKQWVENKQENSEKDE